MWDGDSYNRDSFTIAVLLVRELLPWGLHVCLCAMCRVKTLLRFTPFAQVTSVCPNITLAAFSREGEKDRVIRSWKQRLEVLRLRAAAALGSAKTEGTPHRRSMAKVCCPTEQPPGAPAGCGRPPSRLCHLCDWYIVHRARAPHSPRNAIEDGAQPGEP